MKIAIEAQVLNHHKRSGLMTYAEGLINGISQLDKENMYSLLYYSLTRKSVGMPGPTQSNFRKVVLPVPDRPFFARQLFIDQFILPFFFKMNKIDVFHRTNGYTMPNCKGVYSILTVHDLRSITISDNLWKQNVEAYRNTINKVDCCVVVSECTKKDLVEHLNIQENKIKVIYLGADKRFKPASLETIKAVREKYNLQEPFLLSIGSVPRKNIEGIIRSFAQSKVIKDYQLILGSNLDVDKYNSLARQLNIGDRVVILSNLDDQDVVALYSACHAFVFPSLYEGFGLPILEAMQCGTPVITSNISSCPEVAGDAAILVDPANDGEIADAINQICTNSHLRESLIQKGFKRIRLFNWSMYADEIRKVYENA